MPCWWWAIIHYRDDSDAELAAKKTLQINAVLKMTKYKKKEKKPEKTKGKKNIIGILKKVKKKKRQNKDKEKSK